MEEVVAGYEDELERMMELKRKRMQCVQSLLR